MNGVFSYYTKYREHVDAYNKWNQDVNYKQTHPDPFFGDLNKLKQKAKAIAEPLLLLDSYEHEKAEDSETFFLTYNIELMSLTTFLASLPVTVTKLAPFLNKHFKSKPVKKASELISKYANTSVKAGNKNISLPKALTVAAAIPAGIFFAKGIKRSMQSQLGIIRKASFDATQNIINNPKLFAVLTPEQEKTVQKIVNYEEANKPVFVEKLKDKVNISTSFQSVGEYRKNYDEYVKRKENYFKEANAVPDKNISDTTMLKAKEDKQLFENLVKNVEHDVLEPLRKVETVANISYSALFTGGFLEYLITDKLVEVLGVKNKALQMIMKLGVPLVTYLMLNKNISDIENKAILATKYKHLKQFTENPQQYAHPERNKKQNFFEFLNTVRRDMQDYDKFAHTELPVLKEKMDAKKMINLSAEQEKEAKLLQKNTSRVINNQREKVYEQSVGIKSLSETILGPIDILATAIGGFTGNKLSKKCTNKKLAGMLTGLGAVIAYIPAAIIEAKLTKQQKLSEKTAVMLALNDMQDIRKFAGKEENNMSFPDSVKSYYSDVFKDFFN